MAFLCCFQVCQIGNIENTSTAALLDLARNSRTKSTSSMEYKLPAFISGRLVESGLVYLPYLHDGIILYLPKESRSGRFLWIYLVPFPMPGTFDKLDRKTFSYAGTLLFTWHQQIYVGKTPSVVIL